MLIAFPITPFFSNSVSQKNKLEKALSKVAKSKVKTILDLRLI
jgi:hypothetical protein